MAAFLSSTAFLAMNFLSNPLVARALWVLPILLVVISIGLVRAGSAQRAVAESGIGVDAEVLDVEVRERSEITHGMVKLRYTPPEASAPVERYVELPLAFMKELEEAFAEDSALVVPIRTTADSDQVSFNAYSRVQWVMTYAFAAMAAVGALGLSLLIGGWNRFLAREGDPADRPPQDIPHPSDVE